MDLNKYVKWHVDRMLQWSVGRKPGPLHLQFNPTDKCNIACRFCWQRDTARLDYSNEVSEDRYVELIKEADELGVIRITITGGGEPWMRPKITMAIVEEVKRRGIYGFMITNGVLLNRERIERIVRSGWDEITISLDSADPELEDYLRDQKGSTMLTIENIKLFNKIKKELHSKTPQLNLHMVLCNKTYKGVPEVVELAHQLEVYNVFIEPFVVQSFDTDDGLKLKLTPEQAKDVPRYVTRGLELCNAYHIQNNFESFLTTELVENANTMDQQIVKESMMGDPNVSGSKERGLKPYFNQLCYEPWWNMIIRANGRVGPCCMFDYTAEYVHSKSLKEIWFGNYFKQLRKNLQDGKLLDFCARCNPSQVIDNRRIRAEMQKIDHFPVRWVEQAKAVIH